MFQAKAKGRGRKRPTQLIIDETDAVQIRGTVSPTSLPLHANLSWQMAYGSHAVPDAEQYIMTGVSNGKWFCSCCTDSIVICITDLTNETTVSGIELCHFCLICYAGLQSLDTEHR